MCLILIFNKELNLRILGHLFPAVHLLIILVFPFSNNIFILARYLLKIIPFSIFNYGLSFLFIKGIFLYLFDNSKHILIIHFGLKLLSIVLVSQNFVPCIVYLLRGQFSPISSFHDHLIIQLLLEYISVCLSVFHIFHLLDFDLAFHILPVLYLIATESICS